MFIKTTLKGLVKLTGAASVATPLTPRRVRTHLSADDCPTSKDEVEDMTMQSYRELVGVLAWLVLGTRTDVAFVTTSLAAHSATTQGVFIGRQYQSNCFSCRSPTEPCNCCYESPSETQLRSPKFLQFSHQSSNNVLFQATSKYIYFTFNSRIQKDLPLVKFLIAIIQRDAARSHTFSNGTYM